MDNSYSIKNSRLGWSNLKSLGDSKFIKSFGLWFVLIPVFAKITETFPGVIDLGVFEPSLKLTWGLPFSLKILYLASVLFTLANVIYLVFCPPIIKAYSSYSDFMHKDGSFEMIKQLFEPLLERSSEKYQFILLRDFFDNAVVQGDSEYIPSTADQKNLKNLRWHFSELKRGEEALPDIFSNIKGAFNEEFAVLQWLAMSLYLAGFLSLAWLTIENIRYVFQI